MFNRNKELADVYKALHTFLGAGISSSESERKHVLRFAPETKAKLINDGAVVYEIPTESIADQQKQKKNFWYIVEAGRSFLGKKSRAMEIAIYPDPKLFFVSDSFEKTKMEQKALLARDTQRLQNRLNVTDIEEIIPEAPEATNVIFQHSEASGVKLLGKTFDNVSMRTNTSTSFDGRMGAIVGYFHDTNGLHVADAYVGSSHRAIGAARFVVPTRSK